MFVMLSLSVSTLGRLKSLLDSGGNRTRDLWFASPMLYQLRHEVKSVRVGDISELSLVPSMSVCFKNLKCFCTQVKIYVCDIVCECVHIMVSSTIRNPSTISYIE